MCLNGMPVVGVKMRFAKSQNSNIYVGLALFRAMECKSQQEDALRLEQLDEDVRGPVRQEDTTTNIRHLFVQPAMPYA